MVGESPSLVKYSPKHTIDSRYERFTAAVMAQRSRTVQPRKVIDVRNLTIIDQYLKHETMDPGLYRDDILKKDPRDKNIAITVGRKVKEVNPEGIGLLKLAHSESTLYSQNVFFAISRFYAAWAGLS